MVRVPADLGRALGKNVLTGRFRQQHQNRVREQQRPHYPQGQRLLTYEVEFVSCSQHISSNSLSFLEHLARTGSLLIPCSQPDTVEPSPYSAPACRLPSCETKPGSIWVQMLTNWVEN